MSAIGHHNWNLGRAFTLGAGGFGLYCLLAVSGNAQQVDTQSKAKFHQSLDNAWWTGPMLAPSASTLPRGHVLVEPYLYDIISQHGLDSNGNRTSTKHSHSIGSLTYVNYGLADRFTIGMIPTFGYNKETGEPNPTAPGVGDLTVQAQFRLTRFHEESRLPGMSFAVQESLPTGKYDQLGEKPTEGLGTGSHTTTFAIYSQTYLWLPNGRILRARFNVSPSLSSAVRLRDVSVYGTRGGFIGSAKPGAAVAADAAGEYSVTRHWVTALDTVYEHQASTRINGVYVNNPDAPVALNSGPTDEFILAPALEYNWNAKLGVLFGTRLVVSGRNTTVTIAPVFAVNIVH